MNANDRREQILDFVNKNHDVSFAAIRELLPEVSEMTIRRDLECLSKDNKIIRVLGGAKSVGSLMITSEDAYVKRSNVQAKSKVIIAQKALKLIQPDSTIFLGSGTTTYQLAKLIPNGMYYIITTCLNCAIELSSLEDVSILMLGGSAWPAAAIGAVAGISFNAVQVVGCGIAYIAVALGLDRLGLKKRLQKF